MPEYRFEDEKGGDSESRVNEQAALKQLTICVELRSLDANSIVVLLNTADAGKAEVVRVSTVVDEELVELLRVRFDLDVPEVACLWPKICARHEEVLAQKASASP